MTKENYEREKARREMGEEIDKARQFSKDAESIHLMLFMGACMIQAREERDPVGTAVTIFKSTKQRAAALAAS